MQFIRLFFILFLNTEFIADNIRKNITGLQIYNLTRRKM